MDKLTSSVPSHYRGVVYAIISALALSLMAFFIKLASATTTASMANFFRFAVSFLYIMSLLAYFYCRGQKFSLKTHKPWLQLLRAATAILNMMLFSYAVRYISLVDATVLIMTAPLFIPILSLIFLKQKVSWKVYVMIFVGFLGVIMILKPGFEVFNVKSIYALVAGFTGATVIIQVKALTKYDQPYTIMFYYFSIAFILSCLISIHEWVIPNFHTLILLLGVGVCGAIYQAFLIQASWHTSATAVSSALYNSIIFSGALDWIFWHKIPDKISFIGTAIVIVSAYFITKTPKAQS